MRGQRLLFVLASLVALGLVGFANFPSDRYAVADNEASQLIGGCASSYTVFTTCGGCGGGGYCGSGSAYACSCGGTCGANGYGCTSVCFYCQGPY